jgi:hypothetical protein
MAHDTEELKAHVETIKRRLNDLSTIELRREARQRQADATSATDPLTREILAAEQAGISDLIAERTPPPPDPAEVAKSNPLLAWQLQLDALQQKIADQSDINAAYSKEGRDVPAHQTEKLEQLLKQRNDFPANPLVTQQQAQTELRQKAEQLTQQAAAPHLSEEERTALQDAAHDLAVQAQATPLQFHDTAPTDAVSRAEELVQQQQDSAA